MTERPAGPIARWTAYTRRPLEESARALKERVYATFTGLAVIMIYAVGDHPDAGHALRSLVVSIVGISAAGFTAEVISTIDASDALVMVGTLDSLSLKNTKLGLETLQLMDYDEAKIQLVLNRADTRVGISHHDVVAARTRPATAATPNAPNAARLTAPGGLSPDATSRTGPTRASSVPRTPSE